MHTAQRVGHMHLDAFVGREFGGVAPGRLERFRVGGAGFGLLLDVEQDLVAPLLPLCAVQTEQLVGADFKKTGDGGSSSMSG